MAELNIFHYLPQQTFLHLLDSRIKLFCLLLLSIAGGFANTVPALVILTILIIVLLYGAKLPFIRVIKEMRFFLLFILFIMVLHALRIPGTPLRFLGGGFLTREGVLSGIFYGWRIILLLFLSAILTGTTTLSSLREGIQSLLRPIPFVPEVKIATMFSMVLAFIPLLLDKAAEMAEAQKSRCVERRRDPVKRMVYLIYPFLTRMFLYTEEVVTAMEARCFTGRRTSENKYLTVRDYSCLVLSVVVCFIIWII